MREEKRKEILVNVRAGKEGVTLPNQGRQFALVLVMTKIDKSAFTRLSRHEKKAFLEADHFHSIRCSQMDNPFGKMPKFRNTEVNFFLPQTVDIFLSSIAYDFTALNMILITKRLLFSFSLPCFLRFRFFSPLSFLSPIPSRFFPPLILFSFPSFFFLSSSLYPSPALPYLCFPISPLSLSPPSFSPYLSSPISPISPLRLPSPFLPYPNLLHPPAAPTPAAAARPSTDGTPSPPRHKILRRRSR